MVAEKKNIFEFGGQVSGVSFLGRRKNIDSIINEIRPGSKGVSIVGLNRIGKSSFINRLREDAFDGQERVIVVQSCVYLSNSANQFWFGLTQEVQDRIACHGIADEEIERKFRELDTYSLSDEKWFSTLSRVLPKIVARLKVLGYQMVLILDEFDQAKEIFKAESGGLGLLRNLATITDFGTTVITLSRRRLYMIEQCVKSSNSTLEGAFSTYFLAPFDEDDMREYWDALSDYLIFPDEEMQRKLIGLAGYQPFLLSMYGNRMAERSMAGQPVDCAALDEIHAQEYSSVISGYYKTLLERMQEDGYAEKLRGVLLGIMTGISSDDIGTYLKGGYLAEEDGEYYILSREFTGYFMEHTRDLYLPNWESVMSVERALKNLVRRVYPRLDEFRYSTLALGTKWLQKVQDIYPELYLDEGIIEKNMRTSREYTVDASIVDVLALKYMVNGVISRNWAKFRPYFGDRDYSEWEQKLALPIRARTPLAHDHPEYLDEREEKLLPIYCQEILEVVQNSD